MAPTRDRYLIRTDRLQLRPRAVEDAEIMRRLWVERDPRVPPHRRISADGRPTVAEIATGLAAEVKESVAAERLGLLAVERRAEGDVIGYCGLAYGGVPNGEPEIAFELAAKFHGNGYASEAARAVLELARANGVPRLWATVWDWNLASRRVLEKLGFHEVERRVDPAVNATNLVTVRTLGNPSENYGTPNNMVRRQES